MERGRSRAGRLVGALVTALVLVAAMVTPAAAHHDFSCAYHNETEFKNLPVGCRNFLIDPGVGQSLTQPMIAAHPELYGKLGISPEFLWYARPTVIHLEEDEVVSWNHCTYQPGAGNACAPGSVVSSTKTIGRAFGGPVDLTVLEHNGMFIGLACGNVRDDRPPPPPPVPTITGTKFLDRDRDGARDGGEPGLGGWRIRLHRLESFVPGHAPGEVRDTVTGPDGGYAFPMNGLPPGRYRVTEDLQPGWVQTRQPGDIRVDFGIGDRPLEGHDFGNVETTADVVKAAFELAAPPTELRADTPTVLRVRATLRNDGPADIVDVTDTLIVTGLEDCALEPRRQTITRRLIEGQTVVVELPVTVTCTEPSFHAFDFVNELAVATPGVTDPDPADNRRQFSHTIPVIDLADISVSGVALACAERSDVDQPFACTVTADIRNAGPHPDAVADVVTALDLPADCAAASDGASQPGVAVSSAAPTAVTSLWTVTCADRSFHPIAAVVTATLRQLHVEDPDRGNDVAGTAEPTVVPIFESADLAVLDLDIACDEHVNRRDFTCAVVTTVTNHGVAEGVQTRTDVTLAAPGECTVAAATVSHPDDLDAAEVADYTDAFHVTCTDARRHVLRATAVIAATEPHAEDRDLADNRGVVDWVPTDVKPRSFPSSINIKKQGLVPVAVLSTPTFNAPALVDQPTLRFGATGTEASWVRCGAPEDVDDDGLADLVCQFEATLTGFTCASTVGVLTGRLREGTAIESQDAVKIVPCG